MIGGLAWVSDSDVDWTGGAGAAGLQCTCNGTSTSKLRFECPPSLPPPSSVIIGSGERAERCVCVACVSPELVLFVVITHYAVYCSGIQLRAHYL